MKLACSYCHATAKAGDRAGFPAETVCKTCHPDGGGAAATRFPSRRVYKVRDLVFFGHQKHAAVECSDCHGAVYEIAAMEKPFRDTSMKSCVDCHKQKNASLNCSICHELGQ